MQYAMIKAQFETNKWRWGTAEIFIVLHGSHEGTSLERKLSHDAVRWAQMILNDTHALDAEAAGFLIAASNLAVFMKSIQI